MKIDESRSIWLQLVEEFRRRIAVGEWPSGQKIPSVRELALELGVSPNTVQRALTETDRMKLTTTLRTSGRFVTGESIAIRTARQEIAEDAVDTLAAACAGMHMDLEEFIAVIRERWPSEAAGCDMTKERQE